MYVCIDIWIYRIHSSMYSWSLHICWTENLPLMNRNKEKDKREMTILLKIYTIPLWKFCLKIYLLFLSHEQQYYRYFRNDNPINLHNKNIYTYIYIYRVEFINYRTLKQYCIRTEKNFHNIFHHSMATPAFTFSLYFFKKKCFCCK